ncbi:peptide chain release factor N(5)-glutamine methyltransferase [Mycoplasmopsis agalactiae]|uniref:peptide chain release factor N(5)-glutamine methyltransferase n=1 Tax=Mycoplasmopsis agalactiae TaxID=2110 RepID=UPI00211C8526|nr:peptide chain release factor N(5)-glutamine methyltransferase [Mycoplasmopsis agalactiae]UUM25519.1 peptide chain release factor N(5)-glutamine methyltransferase [Mycoplasmopsis agalactiae]
MPTIEDLLLEKKRYRLELKVGSLELQKLNQGYPIQYIMGYVEYANVRINLNHKVLIPRYETEELVYILLNEYLKPRMKVLDLCTGSGFIGIALKKNLDSINVTLSDIDNEAIMQANENVVLNFKNTTGIKIVQSDCFKDIKGKFDLIVSNPPYLDYDDKDVDESVKKFEPEIALFAKDSGWYFYEKILNEAKHYLNEGGILAFEINPKHIDRWKQIDGAKIVKDMSLKYRFAFISYEDLR